ncbi:MAG: folylpolyglutamate synthase/dihydrofolate synthase family protein [Polyangiaceae bacterium]
MSLFDSPPLSEQRYGRLLRSLYARGHKGIGLGLDRVRRAAAALGNPQRGLTVLHVAGTNGKGSVSAMLEQIAIGSGLRAGLYTSPHLSRLAERVRVGGRVIEEQALADALERVFIEADADLTFFETLTLAAFVAFHEARVDVAILEVGLGGRLDATNLVPSPVAAGIVSIARGDRGQHLEHANLLGDTVAAIAREKAGVFKQGAPAIIGPLDAEAEAVALTEAARAGAAPIIVVEPTPSVRARDARDDDGRARAEARAASGASFTLAELEREAAAFHLAIGDARLELSPALPGPHQIENAAVAAAMAFTARHALGLEAAAITRGIAEARWAGRLERLRRGGATVWLDCAHNLDGARALEISMVELGLRPDRTLLVFGALADKAFEPMLRLLAPRARAIFYASPEGRAPAALEDLTAIARGTPVGDPARTIDAALAAAEDGDHVVVAGSIYLVGAIRAHLFGIAPDPVIAL